MWTWGALLLAALSPARAHEDYLLQIADVTRLLEKTPDRPDLYYRRGELHRLHQTWDAAHADFDHALALDANFPVDLGRGRLFLDAGWLLSAKGVFDRLLLRQTNNVDAYIARAHTLLKLGQPTAASADYFHAIRNSRESRPDLYIECAQALAAADATNLPAAVIVLDEGVRKLGPLVTLQLFAIDLEVKQTRYDQALARLDQVMANSPRKETWLARKGEILQRADRKAEAAAAYRSALVAMETLPPFRRKVPAMQDLEKRLRDGLAVCAVDSGQGTNKP
jgi:tetratricopeptide (TPR) repeat protein